MLTKTEAVLIFGTFNPITNAHLELGKRMHEVRPEADIIYVPASQDFIKTRKKYDDKNIIPDPDRVDILKKVVEAEGFVVSTAEVDKKVDGITYNTVNFFKETYQNIYICMGMDKVCELHKWYFSEELMSENYFLICTRGNQHIEEVATDEEKKYLSHFTEVEMDVASQEISATQIREAYLDGDLERVRTIIPSEVFEYLSKS